MTDGARSLRLQELIRQEVDFLLRNEIRDRRLDGVFITLVELTGDGGCARIWFSAPEEHEVLEALAGATGFLRSRLEDRDLAVFLTGTPAFEAYRRDLFWAQEYARFNRDVMLYLLQAVVRRFWPRVEFHQAISCHHNYVAEEYHLGEEVLVTRKGAIRAGAGELGIIPGSMGTKSYIVRGRGNPASFGSASHGAGRRLSRTEARRRFSVADLREQTEGIECRKDHGVLDEAPKAYKNIDRVMAQQEDLVEVVAELKQVVCVKG